MQGYNVILVYNQKLDKILMCKRVKNPYKGLSNLVGGKIEAGEAGIDAAYRELFEETGITSNEVILSHLMDFKYFFSDCYLEVYAGKLQKEVTLVEEVNKLFWSDLKENYFDTTLYAGGGNIGHIIEEVNEHKEKVLF